jgi:hypothetical protein
MAIGGTVTIAVSVIAVPACSTRGAGLDGCIDHRERLSDRCIVEGFEAKAHQFQEARVDDGALIKRWAAIAYIITDCRVRITRLREANKVGMCGPRPIGGNSPALYGTLPIVGCFLLLSMDCSPLDTPRPLYYPLYNGRVK